MDSKNSTITALQKRWVDHKLLVAIFKKDVTTLSQGKQHFLLRIHPYRVKIKYKLRPDLFIADWLSRQNHNKNLCRNTQHVVKHQCNTDSYDHTTVHDKHYIQQAMSQDQHLQCLKDYIIQGWLESRDQIPQDIRTYCTFRDKMAVIDGIIIQGIHKVVMEVLQKQALQHLHVNDMGNKKLNY